MALLSNVFLFFSFICCCVSADLTYRCHFESGLCSFLMNDRQNNVNWIVKSGMSMSSGGSGPMNDHTLKTGNGNYIYIDYYSTGGKEVKLQTIRLSGEFCVRFFYHVSPGDVGDLEVYRQSLNDSEDITRYFYYQRNPQSMDMGWKEAAFYVDGRSSSSGKQYRVIFSINRSAPRTSPGGHVALDDITITSGECPANKDKPEEVCGFDYDNCGYKSVGESSDSESWHWQTEQTQNFKPTDKPLIDHTLGTNRGGYWVAAATNTSGKESLNFLVSPMYNATKQSTNCLQFFYYMDTGNRPENYDMENRAYGARLLVRLVDSRNKTSGEEVLEKRMEEVMDSQWTFAETEIQRNSTYAVSFGAGFNTTSPAVIALDDVKILPGKCPPMQP